MNPDHEIFKIVPSLYCQTPEENDFMIYWTMIKQLVFPLIAQLLTINKEDPINIIYFGGFDNSPQTLFQHLDASFNANDFHIGNTPSAIYEWFELNMHTDTQYRRINIYHATL